MLVPLRLKINAPNFFAVYYYTLLLHSYTRWAVLFSLLFALYRGFSGRATGRAFGKTDDRARVLAVTFSHLQLVIGFVLYFISPVANYFWSGGSAGNASLEIVFFGLVHMALMTTAIGVLSVGSALVKRASSDHKKFSTLTVYFSIALLIVLLAVPWPFSPLAARPWFRV